MHKIIIKHFFKKNPFLTIKIKNYESKLVSTDEFVTKFRILTNTANLWCKNIEERIKIKN